MKPSGPAHSVGQVEGSRDSGSFDLDRPGPFVALRGRTSMTESQSLPATVLVAATLERVPVTAALEAPGFSVAAAESGVGALGRAGGVRPGAVILPAALPGVPGGIGSASCSAG